MPASTHPPTPYLEVRKRGGGGELRAVPGEGEIRKVAKIGMAKFGADKLWHQSSVPLPNLVQIPGVWYKNKHRPRMVVVISYGPLVGCCCFLQLLDGCSYFLEAFGHNGNMLGEPKMTPRKRASDLKILWHNLTHCCAKCCHFPCSSFSPPRYAKEWQNDDPQPLLRRI